MKRLTTACAAIACLLANASFAQESTSASQPDISGLPTCTYADQIYSEGAVLPNGQVCHNGQWVGGGNAATTPQAGDRLCSDADNCDPEPKGQPRIIMSPPMVVCEDSDGPCIEIK